MMDKKENDLTTGCDAKPIVDSLSDLCIKSVRGEDLMMDKKENDLTTGSDAKPIVDSLSDLCMKSVFWDCKGQGISKDILETDTLDSSTHLPSLLVNSTDQDAPEKCLCQSSRIGACLHPINLRRTSQSKHNTSFENSDSGETLLLPPVEKKTRMIIHEQNPIGPNDVKKSPSDVGCALQLSVGHCENASGDVYETSFGTPKTNHPLSYSKLLHAYDGCASASKVSPLHNFDDSGIEKNRTESILENLDEDSFQSESKKAPRKFCDDLAVGSNSVNDQKTFCVGFNEVTSKVSLESENYSQNDTSIENEGNEPSNLDNHSRGMKTMSDFIIENTFNLSMVEGTDHDSGMDRDDGINEENLECIDHNDIPFIDDEEESEEELGVVLRQQHPSDVSLTTKRHAQVQLPLLRETVLKNKVGPLKTPAGSCEEEESNAIPEEEKGRICHATDREESTVWLCATPWKIDCVSGNNGEKGRKGGESSERGRSLSLDEDALRDLVQRLLSEKTAVGAADIMSVERRGTKALELWAKRATDGYAGVSISNMTTAWRNGLAFCALIHHYRPDLIDFASLKAENILENNALAFRVAEQQLGIPALLDAEDMVECDVPDRLSVLTYVSQFYQVFSSLGLTSPKRVVNNNASPPPSSPAGVKKTKLSPSQPQPKTKTEIKTDKMLVGGRLRREVCVRCSNPVFLAERLLVGSPGQLMHRTCFRCARCSTQLTLASYYETEKGQFCCETCPDEEMDISPEVKNSIINDTSPKLSRRMSTSDSESEYDSEDSDNESDGYSNTVELVLEDKKQTGDTTLHSPNVTPGPPKPRTVFLSKTLEGESPENSLDKHKDSENALKKEIPKFSQISPALFGSQGKDAILPKASDSGLDHCDDAKGLITDPPDKLTLDTGQDKNNTPMPDSSPGSSSIVAQRLKMFREISNKTNETSNLKNNIYSKPEHKENDLSKKYERDVTSPQFTTDTKLYATKEDNKEIVKEHERDKIAETVDDLDKTDKVSIPDVKIPQEESIDESTHKDLTFVSSTPSISITKESKDKASPEETRKLEVPSNNEISKGSDSECNPFDVEEDESQLDDHKSQVCESNDADVNVASLSQDSGAELSSPSLRSIQYPEELNPFGSDDEDEGAVSISESVEIDKSKNEAKKDEVMGKKLIKANLNPFESDEDEEERDEEIDNKSEIKKENLNPFWSDDEEQLESPDSTPSKHKVKPPRPPPPTLARNSTPSYANQDARKYSTSLQHLRERSPQPTASPTSSHSGLSPSLRKERQPSPSSPSGSIALRRKGRRAPAPPSPFNMKRDGISSGESTADTTSMDTMSLSSLSTQGQGPQDHEDGGLVRKPSMSKSEAGEWQRKKGPAPPRPVPQKRAIKKMPMRLVQQELHDIEVKQTELERQGVLLETSIRKRTEGTSNNPQEDAATINSGPSSIEVEDMIMQLFELVNEKNELFRRQTELMYLKREKRLEEEHVELEFQIRCLMLKPPSEKTESDNAQEEELIARLVKVVEQRDEIINCLELDRLREAQEDESIATHMMQYQEKHIDGIENGCVTQNVTKKKKTLKLPRKKKKKEKKDKKGAKADADKDIDETEVKESKKRKKKWLF
ncbi:MICAL-like protein 1 isoform X2 [Palaemon carinicauda]|uniref:MICAL-like protein 1 isoform X2 n=1 Tax=Palaemon carinicauda TaxID=392227 RepID=UPI0035B60C2E